MITNPQKTSYRYLRKLLVLPVAVLVIVLFAFRYKSENRTTVASLKEQITIVVDAGHGGNDPGVQSPDNKFNEAQLSLQLAKKIQLLAPDYNINVVLTRKGNAFPGGATTNAESHLKRMEIAARAKPAVFISLHINSVMGKEFQKTNSGIEAYVSATRNDEEGRRIASAILQELSAIYKTATELKMRKGNSIPVLDNNTCPAVILECGFINNAADLAFITDPANQEKIARKILAGIAGYKNYSASSSLIDAPSQGPLQKAVVLTDKDTFLVEADSLIFDMRKKNADATSPLVIINGKKVSYSYLTGKEIQAEGIKVYSRNDQRAIRTYGRDAANGLIVFEGATVNEQQATDRPILDTPKRKDGVRMHHKDAGKNGLKEVIVTGHGKKNIVRSDVVTTEGKKQRADVVTVQGHGVLKPDPATNTVTIPFSTQQGGEAEIIVSDKASSAESMKVKTTLVSGPNHLKFDVSSLPKGEYTIVVKVGDAAKKPVRTYNMVKQ